MAQWIWHSDTISANQWGCFHKTFDLPAVPTNLFCDIAVDSKYWLWVNGVLVVREGGLKRGPTPNDTYVDRVDIASHLRGGSNTVAALVWYWGVPTGGSHRSSGCPGFYLNCEVPPLQTDATWKAGPHPAFLKTQPMLFNNVHILPEWDILFDANQDIENWVLRCPEHFENATELGEAPCAPWKNLVQRPIPFWRDSDLLEYQTVCPHVSGECKEDTVVTAYMPANVQCYPYFRIRANGGEKVRIQAERDWRTNEYIAKPGVQEFECPAWGNGHFVRYTFPKGVEIVALKYRETGYDTDCLDTFSSDDPALQTLWDKSVRSTYINMRDHFTDCPDRERQQWTGDAASTIEQVLYAFDDRAHALIRKFFCELINWAGPSGELWGPVPCGRFQNSFREFPAQTMAAINALRIYYEHTKDVELLKIAFPAVRRYLLELWHVDPIQLLEHRGPWEIAWSEGVQAWYDWNDNIDMRLLDNTWYYIALNALSMICDVLQEEEAKAQVEQRKGLMKAAFDDLFWDGKAFRSPGFGSDADDRGNALAVYGGLADESKWDALSDLFETAQFASIYMEKYVIEALFLMGRGKQAMRRMKSRLANEIASPYSTMPECFGEQSNHAWGGWPIVMLKKYDTGNESKRAFAKKLEK